MPFDPTDPTGGGGGAVPQQPPMPMGGAPGSGGGVPRGMPGRGPSSILQALFGAGGGNGQQPQQASGADANTQTNTQIALAAIESAMQGTQDLKVKQALSRAHQALLRAGQSASPAVGMGPVQNAIQNLLRMMKQRQFTYGQIAQQQAGPGAGGGQPPPAPPSPTMGLPGV